MRFHILTLFKDMVTDGLNTSILGRALEKNLIETNVVDIRDYTLDKHKKVDDYPYGGGAGMVMQIEPVDNCICAFNEKFHTSQSYYNIKSHCQRKGFQGGSSYQKGYKNWRSTPIGTEKIYNGRVYVKVSDAPAGRNHKNHMENWKPKGQVVWEQHHGKVPEGYCVVYLDGNPLNCDISNLECTTNSIQGSITKPFQGTSPDLKRCAIKMKTLEKILEGIGENENG